MKILLADRRFRGDGGAMKRKSWMLLATVCSIFGTTGGAAGGPLELGKKVPAVEAKTQAGELVKLRLLCW